MENVTILFNFCCRVCCEVVKKNEKGKKQYNQGLGDRSSRSQMFFKIDVLKHFTIFTGKHLCWSL